MATGASPTKRRRQGWVLNHKRVLRIMREETLLCQLQRRFVVTTNSRHGFAGYPNLLRERIVDGPNQAWVADLTYIRLPTTCCYLAAILDAFSRRVVGWELSSRIDTDLTLAALERAVRQRHPAPAGSTIPTMGCSTPVRAMSHGWSSSGPR